MQTDTDKEIFRLLTLDPQHNMISWLAKQVDEGDLDVDPPYQRESVWGTERKVNLIRSLTMGLPIGAIFINRRNWREPEVVVDGKQRLLAVRDWLRGEIAVPAVWFPASGVPEDNDGTVTFDQLSQTLQSGWKMNAGVLTYRTQLADENDEAKDADAQEAALFDLINYGGVPQGERDPDA